MYPFVKRSESPLINRMEEKLTRTPQKVMKRSIQQGTMKINYLAYLDPGKHQGGGEVVLGRLLEVGRLRGHEIAVTSTDPGTKDRHRNPDLWFLADLFNCPTRLTQLSKDLIREACRGKYVHFDNAYVDCCNLDYLPCSGSAQEPCPHKSPWNLKRNLKSGDFGSRCFGQDRLVQELYRNSRLNLFVSPLHQKTVYQVLGLPQSQPHLVLRPLIDPERFKDQGQERDLEYLFVGAIGEAKGAAALAAQYGNADLHLIGASVDGKPPGFGTWHGKVPYLEIPGWMNRAKRFVFLPRWPEPQGRVVIEAALCGCELVLNGQVGAASFDFDLKDPKNLTGAEEEFWLALEALP